MGGTHRLVTQRAQTASSPGQSHIRDRDRTKEWASSLWMKQIFFFCTSRTFSASEDTLRWGGEGAHHCHPTFDPEFWGW